MHEPDKKQLKKYTKEMLPPVQCSHNWDCCGRYFTRADTCSAEILHERMDTRRELHAKRIKKTGQMREAAALMQAVRKA